MPWRFESGFAQGFAFGPAIRPDRRQWLRADVLVPVLGLINVRALRQLYAFHRVEFMLAVIVAALGLSVGLLPRWPQASR